MVAATVAAGTVLAVAALVLAAVAWSASRADRAAAQERAAVRDALSGQSGGEKRERRPEWLAARLEAAGSQADPGAYAARCAAATAVAAVAGTALAGPALGAAFALAVPLGCWAWLTARARGNTAGFEEQMAHFLPMVERNMRAGQTFENAARTASAHMGEPLRSRFAEVDAARKVGVPLPAAMDMLARRTGSSDAQMLAAAVAVQAETGGALAEVIGAVGESVQRRVKARRKVRAITAQGRLSAVVVFAMPFALAGVLTAISPGYLTPLLSNPFGIAALAATLALAGVGMLIVRGLLRTPIY